MNSKILNQVKFSIILLVFCFSCTKEKEAETAGLKTNIQALKKVSEDLSFKIACELEHNQIRRIATENMRIEEQHETNINSKIYWELYRNGVQIDILKTNTQMLGFVLSRQQPNFLTTKSFGYGEIELEGSGNLIVTKKNNGYIVTINEAFKDSKSAIICMWVTRKRERWSEGCLAFKIID